MCQKDIQTLIITHPELYHGKLKQTPWLEEWPELSPNLRPRPQIQTTLQTEEQKPLLPQEGLFFPIANINNNKNKIKHD